MATERLRLGISSYTYPWAVGVAGDEAPPSPMTVDDLLEHAVELEAEVLQIADNVGLHSWSDAELRSLRARAGSRGIAIEVGTRGIAADHLVRYLEIAVLLASPILRVVVDRAGHEPSPAEIVSLLRGYEHQFRSAGVALAIENHDRLSSTTLAAVVEQLGTDWVGICLDTVNSLGALEGPDVVLRTLGPYVLNLHVKDFDIVRSNAGMGFDVRGRPVGSGRLELRHLLRSVSRSDRQITAVIELWTPRQATIAETVALEGCWARQSATALARAIRESVLAEPVPP